MNDSRGGPYHRCRSFGFGALTDFGPRQATPKPAFLGLPVGAAGVSALPMAARGVHKMGSHWYQGPAGSDDGVGCHATHIKGNNDRSFHWLRGEMNPLKWFCLCMLPIVMFVGCITSKNMERSVEGSNLNDIKLQLAANPSLLNKRDDSGKTLLHLASEKGRKEIVAFLLAEGASPNVRDRVGSTPIHAASYEGHLEIVKQLFDAGANVNAADDYGISPLLNTLFTDNDEIASYLLLNGANGNYKSPNGNPALILAAQKANLKFFDLLLKYDADISELGQFNTSVLHAAISSQKIAVVKHVISRGAEINGRDAFGRTPLHQAVINESTDIVAYLVAHGANLEAKDSNGYTPLQIAENKGLKAVESILTRSVRHGTQAMASAADTTEIPQTDPIRLAPSIRLSGPDGFGTYHALIIGNNNYIHLPGLKTAVSDAREIARILGEEYHFHVTLLLNANRPSILLALTNLRSNLTLRDNLLIYYAGHGWLDREGDEGYWLPVDAERNNNVNWVSNSSITTMLKAMKAKHIMIVADSCYSGKLARGIHIVHKSPDYLQRMAQKKARSVLSSGGLEPVVDSGGSEDHSIFAWAFINALNENDSAMSGTELFLKIRRPVMLDSDQTPEYSDIRKAGHDGGDFIFIKAAQ